MPLASNEEGDTGAEDNAWNAPTPALAAVMFPDDPQAEAWRTAAIRLALNASSTAADESSARVVDGRPLGEWMASVNLHPDLTLENHGFFNPIYQQVVHVSVGDAASSTARPGSRCRRRSRSVPRKSGTSCSVGSPWTTAISPCRQVRTGRARTTSISPT